MRCKRKTRPHLEIFHTFEIIKIFCEGKAQCDSMFCCQTFLCGLSLFLASASGNLHHCDITVASHARLDTVCSLIVPNF